MMAVSRWLSPLRGCRWPRESVLHSSGASPGRYSRASFSRAERPVQVGAGCDQRQVGKGLGKVTESLAGRTDLLGVEADMVAIREQFLQQQTRLIELADHSQVLDEPETARTKGSFPAGEAIVGRPLRIVAAHQCPSGEFLLNALHRGMHPWFPGAGKVGDQQQQGTGIHRVAAIILDKAPRALVPALGHDLLVDGRPALAPVLFWRGPAPAPRHAQRAIECDPAHQARVQERLGTATHFPDSLVWLLPVLSQPCEQGQDVLP